jgi:hypothetical protein
MTKFSFDVANTVIRTSTGKDCPLELVIDLTKIPNEVHAVALVNAYLNALNNIPRSNGQGETPKTDKQWHQAKLDKIAVWEAGSWAATGRGGERDSLAGVMREAFVAEQSAKGIAPKQVEKAIKQAVTDRVRVKRQAKFCWAEGHLSAVCIN